MLVVWLWERDVAIGRLLVCVTRSECLVVCGAVSLVVCVTSSECLVVCGVDFLVVCVSLVGRLIVCVTFVGWLVA